MRIELFFLDGCPNVESTVERIGQVLQQCGLQCPITRIRVADTKAARELNFLGSPTVHINGLDIEPSARSRNDYGLMCRTCDASKLPSEDLIRNAVVEAIRFPGKYMKERYETEWEGLRLVVEARREYWQVIVYDPADCEVVYSGVRMNITSAKFAATEFVAITRS